MKVMKNFKLLLGALSMLTLGSANASTLVLDGFNYDPALSIFADPNNTVATATVTAVATGALADYTLKRVSGLATNTVKGNVFGSGALSYGEEPDADGTLDIAYSLPGGSTLDFTGYSDFYFDVESIDGSGGFDVLLTLEDSDGTEISASYNISSEGIFLASFATMMAGEDFDFSLVKSATASISSVGTGDDFALNEVGLVPEPSALAILGLGLIGLGLGRRKLV